MVATRESFETTAAQPHSIGMPQDHAMAETEDGVVFSRVIRPHRSAGPRTLARLLMLLAIPLSATSVVFLSIGAWPVTGFLGLDAVLVGGAFWLHQHSSRAFETIGLTAGALTVERVDAFGRRRSWTFEPGWLNVRPISRNGRHAGLELRSHGRSLIIARFLPPEQIPLLASDLGQAISRLTSPFPSLEPA